VDDRVVSQVESREQLERIEPAVLARLQRSATDEFAGLLEQLREERGLSKAELAKRTGLDPSTITRFEQGSRAPERATILQLADAMVLPMTDRDRLLAAAGFRSEIWDDPMLIELAQLVADRDIPSAARHEARSVIRMAIAYLKLQRLKDS
jgi:transcriptional regulator with XRE-family HTH domain